MRVPAPSGLLGWSVRDLAARLGTSTSAVYHHVGGRDEIARRVVERVLVDLPRADAELAWQEWFRTTLRHARAVLLTYPGVAHWLLMHGPAFPGALDIVDAGVRVLTRAGFGARAPVAYSMLFNTAMAVVALNDDRRAHEADGPRDHGAMMRDFAALAPGSAGITALLTVLEPMAGDPDQARTALDAYYDDLVETILAGLAQGLS